MDFQNSQESTCWSLANEGVKQTGEQALILRQLTRRVGSLAPEMLVQVQALSLAQLESLGEALLDFAEAGDLVRWLEGN